MTAAAQSHHVLRRRALWSLLGAVMLAVVVTVIMAPRWRRPTVGPPPPVLGQVEDFELVDHQGGPVSRRDLLGAPWVADFIFTRCALSCPRMTSTMARLGRRLSGRQWRRISFTVDPQHDTPEVLRQYAETWGISDPSWLLLTGDPDTLRTLTTESFRLAFDASPPAELADPREPILHSTRFVLVDRTGAIRGYYAVEQGGQLERLVEDLKSLLREK